MHITLGPLFDLVQQHIHRLDGHFLFRLLNGGKVDARQRSGGDVVKSDEGQIPRDADMSSSAAFRMPSALESVEAKIAG